MWWRKSIEEKINRKRKGLYATASNFVASYGKKLLGHYDAQQEEERYRSRCVIGEPIEASTIFSSSFVVA